MSMRRTASKGEAGVPRRTRTGSLRESISTMGRRGSGVFESASFKKLSTGAAPPDMVTTAADDAPTMIITYTRDEGLITYINREVYKTLGPDATVGKHVEELLEPAFRRERTLEVCRFLFGVGQGVESKKSSLMLRSAAGNALPANLVMRATAGSAVCTANLFPGTFAPDLLDWHTALTAHRAPSPAHPPLSSLLHPGHAGVRPIFVEMDELVQPPDGGRAPEWREVARWRDGLEQRVLPPGAEQGGGGGAGAGAGEAPQPPELHFGKAHLSSVKFQHFIELRKVLAAGVVKLDLDLEIEIDETAMAAAAKAEAGEELRPAAEHAGDDARARAARLALAEAMVDALIGAGHVVPTARSELIHLVLLQHVHATERRKKAQRAAGVRGSAGSAGSMAAPPAPAAQRARTKAQHDAADADADAAADDDDDDDDADAGAEGAGAEAPEACDVLAGTVELLAERVGVFVRLKRALDLGSMTEPSAPHQRAPAVRFVFLCLGPSGAARETHSVGHALATLMSHREFAGAAQLLGSKQELLEAIDGSIDSTNLTFAQNIEVIRIARESAAARAPGRAAAGRADGGCCGLLRAGGAGGAGGGGSSDEDDDVPEMLIEMGELDGESQPVGAGWIKRENGMRRRSSIRLVEHAVSAAPPEANTKQITTIEAPKEVIRVGRRDYGPAALVCACSLFAVLIMVFWHPHSARHDVLTAKMTKYNTHITSPLFATSRGAPLVLPLSAEGARDVVDVKLVAACTLNDCGAGTAAAAGGAHRQRRGRLLSAPRELADAADAADAAGAAGALHGASWVRWTLRVGDGDGGGHGAGERLCASARYALRPTQQVEVLTTVDVMAAPCADAARAHGARLSLDVSTDAVEPLSVLVQPIQIGPIGRHRILLGGLLFVVVFAGIISEVIHRCYTTFLGSFLALALLALTHEVPEVHTVVAMIDAGTLMLLFAMMVNVHLLSLTGFFQWASVRMVELSRGNTMALFFLLTNLTGFLSAFLDNVTCVMLIGPVTIKLCEQMKIDPVPFYLSETIAATIGGTATLIGDPPNVVIGNKLQLGFTDFLIFNGPLVLVIMPLSTVVQYLRFRHTFPTERVQLDLGALKAENKIHDERSLLFLAFIFGGIFLGLFLFELHGHEPSWFCLLGMLGASIATSPHNIHHAIAAVEWDTLLFFAGLFVFVESLAEIGLIRFVGGLMSGVIRTVPLDARLSVAMVIFLWVSAIGSAFLESLPYTTTITYIIINLLNEDDLEIPILPLAWALSVGACVGGIGSIMGSSANLVSMAVSERYAPANPIKGKHFLQYGFPLLLLCVSIATGYQQVLFTVIQPYKQYH